MATYQGNTHSDDAKREQIITEFFAKTVHIIMESRCCYVSSRNYSGEQFSSPASPSPSSSSSSPSSFRRRDKWFNLALKDCPASFENIDFWRQSNLEPMIVDVFLVKRQTERDPFTFFPKKNLSGRVPHHYNLDNDGFSCEKIIERWIIQYESKKSGRVTGSKRSTCPSSHALYMKSILLLRSLYAMVRILPAYKLFRDLISSARIGLFNLAHRVSSFVEPFTHGEEADMKMFVFTPIESNCGRLCLSVSYCSSLLDVNSEHSITPISPQFIPEYVGSPMAEPLRRLPSLPNSYISSYPFGRRHSWSCDFLRASPLTISQTPSTMHSESHASLSKQHLPCLPPATLTCQLRNKPDSLKRPCCMDHAATVSPSQSPSPFTQQNPTERHNQIRPAIDMMGDLSDFEFSGAFVLDDFDMAVTGSRKGLSDQPRDSSGRQEPFYFFLAKTSQVGALVHLLQKAPPLRKAISVPAHFQQGANFEINKNILHDSEEICIKQREQPSASPISCKTVDDALNELLEYKEMKDKLRKWGKFSQA